MTTEDEGEARLRENQRRKLPGKTMAESLGIEVDPKAPGGQKMASAPDAGGQRNTRGRHLHTELETSGFSDYDALNSGWGRDD